MKNVFVPTSLFLVIGYSLAIVARCLGLISGPILSLPMFVGFFTAANLLAMVCHSYGDQRGFRAPKLRRRVLRTAPISEPLQATWTYQTISA
jgi:hypothetical protein